jgi:hypothetical protein
MTSGDPLLSWKHYTKKSSSHDYFPEHRSHHSVLIFIGCRLSNELQLFSAQRRLVHGLQYIIHNNKPILS